MGFQGFGFRVLGVGVGVPCLWLSVGVGKRSTTRSLGGHAQLKNVLPSWPMPAVASKVVHFLLRVPHAAQQ